MHRPPRDHPIGTLVRRASLKIGKTTTSQAHRRRAPRVTGPGADLASGGGLGSPGRPYNHLWGSARAHSTLVHNATPPTSGSSPAGPPSARTELYPRRRSRGPLACCLSRPIPVPFTLWTAVTPNPAPRPPSRPPALLAPHGPGAGRPRGWPPCAAPRGKGARHHGAEYESAGQGRQCGVFGRSDRRSPSIPRRGHVR